MEGLSSGRAGAFVEGLDFGILPSAVVAAFLWARVACLYPAFRAWDEGVNVRCWWVQTLVTTSGGIAHKEISTLNDFCKWIKREGVKFEVEAEAEVLIVDDED